MVDGLIVQPDEPSLLVHDAEALVARRVRSRVLLHIADAIERDVRGGQPRSTEAATVEQLLDVIHASAGALDQAAADLNNAGRGLPANRTKQAAMRAKAIVKLFREGADA